MYIQSVKVTRPKDRTSAVLAFVEMTIDNGVTLRNMRLLRGPTDDQPPLLRMPSELTKNETRRDIFYPIHQPVRDQMTAAALAALRQAEEQNVNLLTVQMDETDPSVMPEFSQIEIYKFPGEGRLKALVSCLVDDSIALRRMAVMVDEDTKMLRVRMPSRYIPQMERRSNYYYLSREAYQALYRVVMENYAQIEDDEDTENPEEISESEEDTSQAEEEDTPNTDTVKHNMSP